ncbi:MAG: SMC-Scp complex subunit ScpB [Oscillospiraceae bacterium]|nr:SMC-Scp complex subunit ScpB [Oscillospiraceae bacterium]
MDLKTYKAAAEAILFAYGEPVSAARIADVLEIETAVVERLLRAIKDDLEAEDRGLVLLALEDRWQLSTKSEFGDFVRAALDNRRNVPLSQAALETLSIIAYNQPVSRSFIEQVRGVDSSSTVQNLLSKGLIEEAGRLDLPGRPVSFRTTDVFLRTFGLSSLHELPPLREEQDAPDGAEVPETPQKEFLPGEK